MISRHIENRRRRAAAGQNTGRSSADSATRSSNAFGSGRQKRIAFKTDISDDLPRLFVDVRRINQVLENLLSNAFKFTPSGGEILIGARRWGDAEVLWWVKDSGIGVPREEFDHIFDKYRQVIDPQHYNQSGTGLGLAICKKIIEAHGGQVVGKRAGQRQHFFCRATGLFRRASAQDLTIPA